MKQNFKMSITILGIEKDWTAYMITYNKKH